MAAEDKPPLPPNPRPASNDHLLHLMLKSGTTLERHKTPAAAGASLAQELHVAGELATD